MNANLPAQAVLYTRISDARNGDDHGTKGQEKRLREHAARLGWGVGRVVVENDTSAFARRKVTLPDGRRALRVVRPGWRSLLDDLANGAADGLLALDLDRACRDPRDLEDLIDVVEAATPRLPVESVTGSLRLATDADVTSARIGVAIANKASRDTGRRVADSRQHDREAGIYKPNGRRAFGFESDGVTPRPAEIEEIKRAADAMLSGVSLRQVTASLRDRGVPSVTGAQWAPGTVRDMLRRPRNAGLLTHGDEPAGPAPWDPIVPEERWRALRALLDDPERRTSPGNTPRHLGSLLYECGHGEHGDGPRPTVRATAVAPGHGQPNRTVYRCSVRPGHNSRTLTNLDPYVERVIIARLSREDAAELLVRPEVGNTSGLEREAEALRKRRTEAKDLWQAGVLSAAELKSRDAKLRERLTEVEAQLAGQASRSPLAGLAGRADAADVWAGLDLGRRRAVLRELVTVVVMPGARTRIPGGARFDPDGVRFEWRQA